MAVAGATWARARGAAPAVATIACLLLVPVGLGWIAPLRRAWGYTLWLYLPAPVAFGLAGGVVLLCWPQARRALVRLAARAFAGLASRRPLRVLAWLLLPVVFWLLRERHLFGDSNLFLLDAHRGAAFSMPDIGASFLIQLAVGLHETLGLSSADAVKALVCIAGAVALGAFAWLGGLLAPTRSRRAVFVALVLGGGLARVLVGHLEVYALVLACAALYFAAACSHLAARAPWPAPALALGVGLWMHLSFAFLVPTLPLVLRLAAPRLPLAAFALRSALSGVLALAPLALFLGVMFVTGHQEEIARAWEKGRQVAGLEPHPHIDYFWVWEGGGGRLDYAFLSAAQLKYLANALYLLAPAAVPVILGFALSSRRSLFRSPRAIFLAGAAACTILYALVLRPLWGPYDWDLFSLTAVSLSTLAAFLLVNGLGEELPDLAALLVGAALLLVTIPFVVVGIAPSARAGPFDPGERIDVSPGESFQDAVQRHVAPWL